MKICPHCRNTYTDDSLQYCLQDGTPLNDYKPSEAPTAAWNNETTNEAETLVKPRQSAANYETQKSASRQDWQPSEETVFATAPPEPEKSNTLKVVLLTLLGMVVLLGIGGVAAFVIWKNSRREVANANTRPVNAKTPVANKSLNSNQNDNVNTNLNTNVNANTNANTNINANVPTPTPKPTLNPEQLAQTKEDVGNVIDDWKSSYESLDLEYAMSYYAETVDYYNVGKVGIGRVRADKQRAFDAYDTINFNISNLVVTPDATGDRATAIFDKEWNFENSEKTNSGKVQQQMQLVRSGGKWKITGEKDLKVYYINK